TRFSRDWSSDVCSSDLSRETLRSRFKKVDSGQLQWAISSLKVGRLCAADYNKILNTNISILTSQYFVLNTKKMNTIRYIIQKERSEERRVGKEQKSKCT